MESSCPLLSAELEFFQKGAGMLGGYPHTITKTLKHQKMQEKRDLIVSMDDRNNHKAKERGIQDSVYILLPSCHSVES